MNSAPSKVDPFFPTTTKAAFSNRSMFIAISPSLLYICFSEFLLQVDLSGRTVRQQHIHTPFFEIQSNKFFPIRQRIFQGTYITIPDTRHAFAEHICIYLMINPLQSIKNMQVRRIRNPADSSIDLDDTGNIYRLHLLDHLLKTLATDIFNQQIRN